MRSSTPSRFDFWGNAMRSFAWEARRPGPMKWCGSAGVLGLNIYTKPSEIPKAE